MSFFPESEADLVRQVAHAIEDQGSRPLDEVRYTAPDDCRAFSELECAASEWSFGCGVAWTLVRLRDPFAAPEKAAEVASRLAREAWRTAGSNRSWTALLARDRAERGPVSEDPGRELDEFTRGLGRMQVRRTANPARAPDESA